MRGRQLSFRECLPDGLSFLESLFLNLCVRWVCRQQHALDCQVYTLRRECVGFLCTVTHTLFVPSTSFCAFICLLFFSFSPCLLLESSNPGKFHFRSLLVWKTCRPSLLFAALWVRHRAALGAQLRHCNSPPPGQQVALVTSAFLPGAVLF